MTPIVNEGPDSFSGDLAALFEAFQEERTRLLAAVRELQLGSQLLGAFEAQRLVYKFGDEEPRALVLQARGATILERVEALDVELEVATIRVPVVTGTETLVHGRVTDDARVSARGATAILVDDRRRPIDAVSPVEIDEAGYYAFVLSQEVVEKLGPDRKVSVEVERDDVRIAPARSAHFAIEAAAVKVNDVALSADELLRLKLRPAFVVRKQAARKQAARKQGARKQAARKQAARNRARIAR